MNAAMPFLALENGRDAFFKSTPGGRRRPPFPQSGRTAAGSNSRCRRRRHLRLEALGYREERFDA